MVPFFEHTQYNYQCSILKEGKRIYDYCDVMKDSVRTIQDQQKSSTSVTEWNRHKSYSENMRQQYPDCIEPRE